MGTRVLLRTRPRTARPKPLAGQRTEPADESGKRAGRPLDARRKARVHSPLRHDGDDRTSRQLRHRSIRRCAGLSFQEVQRRRGPQQAAFLSGWAAAGSPPRASCGMPTTASGKETAAGDRSALVKALSLRDLQQPTWWHGERHTTCVAGNPPPKPCWCAATPLSPSSGAATAQAHVLKASGRRPRSPEPRWVPLTGDDHGFQVRGGTWGTVSRQGSRPRWPDTK